MDTAESDAVSNTRKRIAALPVVTLLILALLAAAPLWGPGIVNTRAGGDSPFLLWRTYEMAANLRAGVFPVRWMPDAAYGYGYPFFSYMAVLPFYVAGVLNVLGIDILTAIKLTQTLGFVAAAFGMYGWMRCHLARSGAWLAAAAYTFASFHLVNVYTRGDSLHEFYAFVFFPLILWAVDKTFEQHNACSVVVLALAYGGLTVTHNVSALLFSPFVLLYVVVQAAYHLASRASPFALRTILALCALGLVLGLALSAWFWIPALGETGYGQLGEQTTGYFNYSNHFRGADLVQPTLAFDYDVGKTTPFAMSSAQAALALLGVVAIVVRVIRQRRLDALSAFTLIGLLVSTAMITRFSKPLWDHLPLLPLAQFPWRFLTVQSVFTALATAQVAGGTRSGQDRGSTAQDAEHGMRMQSAQYVAVALGLPLAFTALINLNPDRLYISPADVTTERLQLYEMFTANIGTTIRYEYLPRGVAPRLYTSDALIDPGQPMPAVALEGESTATRLQVAPIRQVWHVTAGSSGATVAFPILWWPGWQATVDGGPAAIRSASSSGRIVLDVASGEHTVVVSLGRTPLRAVAESVSLAVVIAVLIVWLRPTLKRRAENARGDESSLVRRVASGFGSLSQMIHHPAAWMSVLVLLVAAIDFGSRSVSLFGSNDETMDFVSQPYLHHNPVGAMLKPDLRLLSYNLPVNELAAGQTLDLGMFWYNAGSSQPVTVALVSPAQHLVGLEEAPVWAQSSVQIAPGNAHSDLSLNIPPQTPGGVYLLKVPSLGDAVYLRPVRVRNERPVGDAPVLAQFGDRIRLHRVRVESVIPSQLVVTLDWSAARPVEANYGIRVRLFGSTGDVTTPTDLESPGYGFLPTSLWRPGNLVSDQYTIHLPEGTPPRNDYQVEILLYDRQTQAGLGLYVQSNIALTQYSRRAIDSPVLARFGPEIALATLDVPAMHQQGAPRLAIKPGWLATSAQPADRIARWTIYDSRGTALFTQTHDLVAGLPSSGWPAGAFVIGETSLNIPVGLEPGMYRLGVTVINLTTRAEEGNYVSASTFEIVGHPRNLAVPPMTHRSDVEFGRQIKLLGYDLKYAISTPRKNGGQSIKSQFQITLYWQAMTVPSGDYKVFVHVFDPTNEQIVAQHDAMPLEGQYPTSWWATGEVVSETVTLDLKEVRPGAYRLAVGLYDARTVTRLAAIGSDGMRLDADRVVLPENILVPKK